ncbi:thioesterase family protein [Dongia sedimenti]|uniref:Thioesterase family protein n=1 Tax=Dongia sedimenti TaxID=3064282 RepID=A0ABU0YTW5_9PROT|nr:thioesterase family protein [Rhodospirillaceae bacterium R-7]
MSSGTPPLGLKHKQSITVTPDLTVPSVSKRFAGFQDMPPVFATAFMVGFVEDTCVAALKPHLAPGQRSVGTHVNVSHSAATPIGMTASCEVELVEVDGRKLKFKVHCTDEKGSIGEGFHERVLIDLERFLARLDGKK